MLRVQQGLSRRMTHLSTMQTAYLMYSIGQGWSLTFAGNPPKTGSVDHLRGYHPRGQRGVAHVCSPWMKVFYRREWFQNENTMNERHRLKKCSHFKAPSFVTTSVKTPKKHHHLSMENSITKEHIARGIQYWYVVYQREFSIENRIPRGIQSQKIIQQREFIIDNRIPRGIQYWKSYTKRKSIANNHIARGIQYW